jgi:membrane protein required for colicin V production
MPADLTALDWVILGGMTLLAVIGLFRGISGELASLVGIATGLVAGYLFYGFAYACSVKMGMEARGEGVVKGVAMVINFAVALVAGGLARILVKKFVSFLVGRALDASLGLLAGMFKGVVVVGLLTGVGIVRPGEYSTGYLVAHSSLIAEIATWADAYADGARQ